MITIYFGLPRCGKTTLAVYFAKKYVSEGKKVYCNFPCTVKGVTIIDNNDIGHYDMTDGYILIDEASVYADSRRYKSFSIELVNYFSLHGHWNNNILMFCQIYNRVDSTIRQMAERVYMVKKNPILRFITTVYRVPYGIAFTTPPTDDKGLRHQKYGEINEGYKEPNFIQRLIALRIIRPFYYKYFDTHYKPYELPPLPAERITVQ